MKTLKLKENLYYVGVVDHDLKVFDSIMPLTWGTTYNSYLLKTMEGYILFEGSKAKFEDEYLANIASICSFDEIKYIMVAHTEPDHSGAIEALLDKNPNITIIASPAAINNMKNILRKPFTSLTAIAGKEMKVGQYTLQFVSGLFLHWPDVIFTYIKEEKALVTCDGFGAHYAFDDILFSRCVDRETYRQAFDYYFDCIMGPFASYAIAACERVRKLDVEWLLTGHGPVIDTDVKAVVDAFEEDGKKNLVTNNANEVTLVYTTCYGYTKEMATYIQSALETSGKIVHSFEIDALNYAHIKPEILNAIRTSSLVLFGTPTVVNDAIPFFYDLLNSQVVTFFANKKFSAFGDYGWSGEGVANITTFAALKKMKTIEGYKYSFKLDGACFEGLDAYIKTLIG